MNIPSSANARAKADGIYHILREASASLLVQLYRAIPEPQNVGRATSTALTLFLLNKLPHSEPCGNISHMTKDFTIDELMFMPDEDIRGFKNHLMECQTKSGLQVSGKIVNFELAANEPHLICGFIMQNGERVGLENIQKLTLII